jgi:hypothetical protein
MNSTNDNWMTKVRQKYTLLLFLATASIPLALWGMIMISSIFSGTVFRDVNKLGSDLFVMFIFPLIAASVISGFALIIAKLFTIPMVRWLVAFGLGIFVPVGAYLLALTGHWIARMLYLGDKTDLPRIPFGAVETNPRVIFVRTSEER